jgi:hypothetical protein
MWGPGFIPSTKKKKIKKWIKNTYFPDQSMQCLFSFHFKSIDLSVTSSVMLLEWCLVTRGILVVLLQLSDGTTFLERGGRESGTVIVHKQNFWYCSITLKVCSRARALALHAWDPGFDPVSTRTIRLVLITLALFQFQIFESDPSVQLKIVNGKQQDW